MTTTTASLSMPTPTMTHTVSSKPMPPMRMASLTKVFGRVALGSALLFSVVATLHPDLRNFVRESTLKDSRKIVSTVQGDLMGNGQPVTVAKIKTRDGLMLEIYQTEAEGGQKLLERIQLPETRDGYFNFNGATTNLAIDDVDGDGRLEIVAPTYDQNLVAHLRIYHYDTSAGTFIQAAR